MLIYLHVCIRNDSKGDDGDDSVRQPCNVQNSSTQEFFFRMEEKGMEEIKEDTIKNGSFA
jgi:hypothetical protein